MQFQKAVRKQVKARVAIAGPAGAGKTYTSLIAARVLAKGGKVAVIDTERQSARLYADEFDFDVLELESFEPGLYEKAINAAEATGYDVLVIDSLSHAWEGTGGALDQKGRLEDQRNYNSWTAWRKITPMHNSLVDTMLRCNMHVIATLRSKMEYEQVKDENGKSIVRKIGLAPIQRQGMEYEFTLFCDMEVNHSIVVSKTRSKPMTDATAQEPDETFWKPFADWLDSGEQYEPTVPTVEQAEPIPYKQAAPEGRPWEPDELKANLLKGAAGERKKHDELATPPEDGVRGYVTGQLNHVCGGDDRRHTFLRFVYGNPSIKDEDEDGKTRDRADIAALLAWIEGKAGPDIVKDEANRVVNTVVQEDAVGTLPGMEDGDA